MLTLYGMGVLMFVWVLGRTFSVVGISHVSLFELDGCCLLATSAKCTTILFNLKFKKL